MPRKTTVTFQAAGAEEALQRFVTWAGIAPKEIHNLGVDVDGLHRFVVDADLWSQYVRAKTQR
jgi:hypothetical protein